MEWGVSGRPALGRGALASAALIAAAAVPALLAWRLNRREATTRRELAASRERLEALAAELAAERRRQVEQVERATRELRLANGELARAGRMKDEFLSNMSHELRTPLNAILTLSESLEEGVYGPLADDQLATLRMIEESGRHLLALINDILDLSKIEAGRIELDLAPMSLRGVCEASLRMLRQQALAKQLHLELLLEPGVDETAADERRLKQILVNLLSNAVKFTPPGGRVELRVTGDRAAGEVTLSVIDTGIGIPAEKQADLFRPFTQVDSSLSRQYGGTGLGLALVHRLTDLHGGKVLVNSAPGRGSRFSVVLPWVVEVVQAGQTPEEHSDGA